MLQIRFLLFFMIIGIHANIAIASEAAVPVYKPIDEILLLSDPLIKAIRANDLNKVESLIRNGTDVNQLIEGISPLGFACGRKSLQTMKVLLENGADATLKSGAKYPFYSIILLEEKSR